MRACALASGSSGNCFYVEGENTGILVDVGISAKKVLEIMEMQGINIKKIKGIFVTHEHSDHIKGIDVFARRLKIPVYATKGTISSGFLCSDNELINQIKRNEIIKIGKLEIEAFTKSHQAAEPVSYTIRGKNKVISIITDAGYACENIIDKISESDFLFLESNHDIEMLEDGPYPYFLKNWIKSNTGHLSNNQASLAVLENASKRLKNVVLSHLSEINNTPEIALKAIRNLLKERSDFNADVSVSIGTAPTKLFNV